MTIIKAIISGLIDFFYIVLGAVLTISVIVLIPMLAGFYFKLAQVGFDYATQLMGNFL